MAETERENIRESTLEGLDTAARKGKHGGRPPVITDDLLHTMLRRRAGGESVEQIQPDLVIPTGKRKGQNPSVASIYRALAGHAKREAYPEAVAQAHAYFATLQAREVLGPGDDAGLAMAVTERVHEQHTEREGQLLEHMREAGRSGAGALGLSEVAAALNAARVAHLVYDPEVRYTGSVGADGALYGGDEIGPDGHPGTPESRLTERLVERALKTGAKVSPIEGAAAGGLRDAAGIAALLRW